MPNLLAVYAGSVFLAGCLGVCIGYIFGLERGMKLERVGTVLPTIPGPLRSFSRRVKYIPKSISEYDQARREEKLPPNDPS